MKMFKYRRGDEILSANEIRWKGQVKRAAFVEILYLRFNFCNTNERFEDCN